MIVRAGGGRWKIIGAKGGAAGLAAACGGAGQGRVVRWRAWGGWAGGWVGRLMIVPGGVGGRREVVVVRVG